MDDELIGRTLDRLEAADQVTDRVRHLVVAALDPESDLAAVVAGSGSSEAPGPSGVPSPTGGATPTTSSSRWYLEEIAVAGFRGIGPATVLDLHPGPGLTLVVGRNGSGKSSFAEAAELVMTGDSFRWKGKGSKVWRDGWRNLHSTAPRSIGVRLLVEGATGASTLERRWDGDAELEDASASLTDPSGAVVPVEQASWTQQIESHRPFLSYSELGSMLEDGPSKLYDALSSILGLTDLVAASARLADERKALAETEKSAKAGLRDLLVDLEATDDERAQTCFVALKGRTWDLDAVESVLAGKDATVDAHGELERARALADLPLPDLDRGTRFAATLRQAAVAVDETRTTDAERARLTADLLEQALSFHDHVGDRSCPVCGAGAIDAAWRTNATEQVDSLRAEATAAIRAQRRLAEAVADARSMLEPPPLLGSGAAILPVDASGAREAARALAVDAPDDPRELADHLDLHLPTLATAIGHLNERARAWWDEHQDRWRPLAVELEAWLVDARSASTAAATIKDIKSGEKWLTETTDVMRAERFEPVAAEARTLWSTMRGPSNVSLDELTLAGTATRRRVDLTVSVDGIDGNGVAVMSQGELNALALSLFLPRATLDSSPFGFVVIDDPVQSMDPTRVDGLAGALSTVAAGRQVVVFTHDDRLPEACRRLAIEARVVEVQRRSKSVVEVTQAQDPVGRYLQEANFLTKITLPDHVARSVIPSLCRQAIEASAIEVLRLRWLRAGMPSEEIDETLDGLETVDLLGYVLTDSKSSTGEAYEAIGTTWGPDFKDVVSRANTAAHGAFVGDVAAFVKPAGQLARRIQKLS